MRVETDLKGVAKKIKQIANDERVGLFFTTEAGRLMDPYTPMDTGMLYQNKTITKNSITYEQNYAKPMFEGQGLNFSKEKHPLATAHWNDAMMSARGHELANTTTEYIRKL